MQKRQHAPPAQGSDGAEQSTEPPRWQIADIEGPANSEVLAALTDVTVGEDEAMSVLQTLLHQDMGEADMGWAEAPGPEEGLDLDAMESEQEAPAEQEQAPRKRPSGRAGEAFDRHEQRIPDMAVQLSRTHRNELAFFKRVYEQHQDRYERVAQKTDIPALLIAAIHYRESTMNFDTYLHQGDPLGKPAVNVPKNIPVFHDWEEAAVHALNLKRGIADGVGLTAETTDGVAMATYAETYNGLGYHYRGLASPYVYAGTDVYTGGRFVRDGVFDKNSFDQRLGVMTILAEMGGLSESGRTPGPDRAEREGNQWALVMRGDKALKQGAKGFGVTQLQEKLVAAGAELDVDGDFGPATRAAVEAFQASQGLKVDGVVGMQTATALDNAKGDELESTTATGPWGDVLQGTTLLKTGSQGDGVRELQDRLRALGYGLQVDGDFGAITRACVVDFQARFGLSADGIVGPATAQVLVDKVGR